MDTTGAALHTLPQKLLDIILAFCNNEPWPGMIKTLYALYRVSKRLSNAAEPFLYQSLVIDDHPGGATLLHRLYPLRYNQHEPRLEYQMTLVKDLRILLEDRSNSVLGPFSQCFSYFTNLKTLVVVDSQARQILRRLPLKSNCFPALESCE